MDKRQLTEIIIEVYKSLTPKKVSVFLKNEDIINIRVVTESFTGMTFSARFKLLNQILKDQRADLFSKYIYVFEAFTAAEAAQLPKSDRGDKEDTLEEQKHSAQRLEP